MRSSCLAALPVLFLAPSAPASPNLLHHNQLIPAEAQGRFLHQAVFVADSLASPAPQRETFTFTSTRSVTYTQWVHTDGFLEPLGPASATSTAPAAVQTWYGAQKERGCDRTACASCRVWYKCQGGKPACFRCDSAPYCECGV